MLTPTRPSAERMSLRSRPWAWGLWLLLPLPGSTASSPRLLPSVSAVSSQVCSMAWVRVRVCVSEPYDHGLEEILEPSIPSYFADRETETWGSGARLLHSSLSHSPLQSVQFRRSVVSNTLPPHGLQHASLLCASPTPGAYSDLQ